VAVYGQEGEGVHRCVVRGGVVVGVCCVRKGGRDVAWGWGRQRVLCVLCMVGQLGGVAWKVVGGRGGV